MIIILITHLIYKKRKLIHFPDNSNCSKLNKLIGDDSIESRYQDVYLKSSGNPTLEKNKQDMDEMCRKQVYEIERSINNDLDLENYSIDELP